MEFEHNSESKNSCFNKNIEHEYAVKMEAKKNWDRDNIVPIFSSIQIAKYGIKVSSTSLAKLRICVHQMCTLSTQVPL